MINRVDKIVIVTSVLLVVTGNLIGYYCQIKVALGFQTTPHCDTAERNRNRLWEQTK